MSEMSTGSVIFVNGNAEQFLTPPMCKGNACEFIGIRGNFRPGTNMIFSFSVRNLGSQTAVVRLTWGDVFGGCNTTTSEVIFPGETIELFAPGEINPGYCALSATVQALTDKNEPLMGAQCTYGGHTFNDGDETCINDTDHVCRNGRWTRLGTRNHCKK
jgi:hypothetical protein